MTAPDSERAASHEILFAAPQSAATELAEWWQGYRSRIRGFTETALQVLEADCSYVVEQGIFGVGPPASPRWPETRTRRGLVMGSVQSGKTASMFGVAAMCLDKGVDLVVVLAGTRISLWRQTLGRLRSQLDTGDEGPSKERRRLLVPNSSDVESEQGKTPLASLYALEPARVRRAVRDSRPIIVVAMKHADHLRALTRTLCETVFTAASADDRPFHMLVLDDEADDGSILDAEVEQSEDPLYGNLKQVPRAIADLWDPRAKGARPANLYATYVAYTATPQANFLQQDHNPLAPKDFIASLRTAYDRGELHPRDTTYFEPRGLSRFYTGGEIFYRRGLTAALTLATGEDPADDLPNALRGFLVAGAIRRLRQPERLGPMSARTAMFASSDDVTARVMAPHSMLIHPSALVSDHFEVAAEILAWASRTAVTEYDSNGDLYLSAALGESLLEDETPWRRWLDSYVESALQLQSTFDLRAGAVIPEWAAVKAELISEIIPGTRVSVVNSDPNADDRPEYNPREEPDGWSAPRDVSTIFVSGNVMARGLTLEGLTTTLFLRRSNQPFADSQMQMQRWFGYRGEYLELCRVIAPVNQLSLFATYHETDEALRQAVIYAMNEAPSTAPEPSVLQGRGFLATGKIANLRHQPLCPGAKPFVRLINSGSAEDPNLRVVGDLFGRLDSEEVWAGGRLRGRILREPLSLEDAADLLDRLAYDDYAPAPTNWQGAIWENLRLRAEAFGSLPDQRGFYRPPAPVPGEPPASVRSDCPYAIAAYLRLWSASLSRHIRGLCATDNPTRRWSMIDLATKQRQQPRFWVGIRFGGGDTAKDDAVRDIGFKIRLSSKEVRDGEIANTWGTRDPDAGPDGFRGDEFLDYYYRGEVPPSYLSDDATWRPVGSDGLILFYVNRPTGQAHSTVATGVCIPLGGPDQFAAMVSLKDTAETPS